MTAALCAAVVLLIAALLVYHIRARKQLDTLNAMLDEAMRGGLTPSRYSESEVSKLEAKLFRILSMNRLARGRLEGEQARIHALIGDISHQTKTPIANMVLYAQLLSECEGLPEEAKPLVEQISAGADKLRFLIQALIKTSRLESGIIQVTPVRGDVRGLIESAMAAYAPNARAKGISLTTAPMAEAVYALFDAKWCAEALHNIVDNAVKYTDEGGEVCVSVTAYEMFVRIDVTDTGRGMREADIPRAFERFWRAPSSRDSQGVGVGLYLAREVLTACGGYVRVRSKECEGSVFSVFLPMASQEDAPQ